MSNMVWGQINPNFSGVNQAMANATNSISAAGDVFGKLRQSILDEEQRAVDNQFKERQAQLAEAGHELNVRKQDHTEAQAKQQQENFMKSYKEGVRQFEITSGQKERELISTLKTQNLNRQQIASAIKVFNEERSNELDSRFFYSTYEIYGKMSAEERAAFKKQFNGKHKKAFLALDAHAADLDDHEIVQKYYTTANGIYDRTSYLINTHILGNNLGLLAEKTVEDNQLKIKREDEQNINNEKTNYFNYYKDSSAKVKENAALARSMIENKLVKMSGRPLNAKEQNKLNNLLFPLDFEKGYLSDGAGANLSEKENPELFNSIVNSFFVDNLRSVKITQSSNTPQQGVVKIPIDKNSQKKFENNITKETDIGKLTRLRDHTNNLLKNVTDEKEKKELIKRRDMIDKQLNKTNNKNSK